ncbi:phosphotriesterase-related protein isoform X1 [Bombus impatiens]|uniref:Phosphotriesterase-related protein n=1 Tax=Bombus impatiens TaxID=132113 RepID=A0A6P8L366_BOMIM|nr:phosphotriesterase-related protein isoform X1 [Bombus impatiens]
MARASDSVETVLGKKDANQLGRTLTHEHLSLNFATFYVQPPGHLKRFLDGKIELRNFGMLKQYPYSSPYNLIYNDQCTEDAILEDVRLYKEFGGGTIVENSNYGLQRNIPFMRKVSQVTGINVIAGTGYYVSATQTKEDLLKEDMYDVMLKEMTIGCEEYPDVKTGFIGEVGSTWPITPFEKRAIQATGEVQQQLKCPVSFHPGRDAAAPLEIMRIYQEAGGDAKKAILSHLDRTIPSPEDLLQFADDAKCYCQFDLFGSECSFYQLNPSVDMISDAQRIDRVKYFRNDQKLDRVLLSHDIHTKHRLMEFGGHGFSHILNNVVPKMTLKGFTSEEIDTLTIHNPRTWLTS